MQAGESKREGANGNRSGRGGGEDGDGIVQRDRGTAGFCGVAGFGGGDGDGVGSGRKFRRAVEASGGDDAEGCVTTGDAVDGPGPGGVRSVAGCGRELLLGESGKNGSRGGKGNRERLGLRSADGARKIRLSAAGKEHGEGKERERAKALHVDPSTRVAALPETHEACEARQLREPAKCGGTGWGRVGESPERYY